MTVDVIRPAPAEALLEGSDHERVELVQDPATGLRAVIAIHSTALGPAVGGLRMRAYPDLDAAVRDALRLSRAMSLKNAAADLALGGGKAVIVDDGGTDGRAERLLAFGDAVQALGGAYLTAEDVGTSPEDMDVIATRTEYVLGRSPEHGGSGDPSPTTARTVLGAIRTGARARLGAETLTDVRIGVIGVGKVGAALARMLAAEGAALVLADADPDRARALGAELGAAAAEPRQLLREPLDVLAPCATGEMIDAAVARELDSAVVAGAANNPLCDDRTARVLHERDVLYVPDFMANCGGMVSIAAEYRAVGPAWIRERIAAAGRRLEAVIEEARRDGRMPLEVARERAWRAISDARGLSRNGEER